MSSIGGGWRDLWSKEQRTKRRQLQMQGAQMYHLTDYQWRWEPALILPAVMIWIQVSILDSVAMGLWFALIFLVYTHKRYITYHRRKSLAATLSISDETWRGLRNINMAFTYIYTICILGNLMCYFLVYCFPILNAYPLLAGVGREANFVYDKARRNRMCNYCNAFRIDLLMGMMLSIGFLTRRISPIFLRSW